MNPIYKLLFLLLIILVPAQDAFAQSAIYACGHIRRHREVAIDNLRNAGYTTAIIFNVSVEPDGSLSTDFAWSTQTPAEAGGIICQNGQYIFDTYQPNYIDDLNLLLTPPTSINRLEFCIGGWTNGSYGNIKALIETDGTGPETILYRNFKALKDAFPCVVAINNDQEQDYDIDTAIAFHKMLFQIGFKTTIAPYTRKAFWQQLVQELNSDEVICDRVYLQTYGGGSANQPQSWNVFGDIPMYVGFDAEANPSISTMTNSFTNWSKTEGVVGGFIWNYNSESLNHNQWAAAINRIFNYIAPADPVATLYNRSGFKGTATGLEKGEYSQSTLSLNGVSAKSIASIQLKEGYKITLFDTPNMDGNSITFTESVSSLDSEWSKTVSSMLIEPTENGSALIKSEQGIELSQVGDVLMISGLIGTERIYISDLHGKSILETSNPQTTHLSYSLNNLQNGLYLITIDTQVFKLIK